jgi:thermitase
MLVRPCQSSPSEEGRRAEALRSALGVWLGGEIVRGMHVYPGLSAVLLELDPSAPSVRIAEQLATCAGPIRYVELDYSLELEAKAPDDRRWSDQGSLRKMSVDAAWDHTTGKREVVVAVIDSGIDLAHPELKGNLWVNDCEPTADPNDAPCPGEIIGVSGDVHGWNFGSPGAPPNDTHGHGTQVAGIIGALGNNGQGGGDDDHSCIAGIAWEVSLVALKVTGHFDPDLDASGLDPVTRAVQYATAIPADVINASFSVPRSELLQSAVAAAGAKGILVVAAAPASQPDVDEGSAPRMPCGIPGDNVVCVTATNDQDEIVPGVSVGATSVDLGATATLVRTTNLRDDDPEGCSAAPATSSIATPHVAGVAALLRARCPGLPVPAMRSRILEGGDLVGLPSTTTGRRLNALKAVAPPCPLAPPGRPTLVD